MNKLEINVDKISKEGLESGIKFLQGCKPGDKKAFAIYEEPLLTNVSNVNIAHNAVLFHGETDNLIDYSVLSEIFGVTQGTINSTSEANKWLHFELDETELYISKVAIRNSISWDYLYSKGLVYGTDDNGLFPNGNVTNQYRTLRLNGKLYKVRLLEGYGPNSIQGSTHKDFTTKSQVSEWSRLFYPIVTNDPSIKSYTGPMLANYTEVDLQMRWINASLTPGSFNWCQEGATSATFRVVRGGYGPSYLTWDSSSTVATNYGWRCVLERIES